MRKKLDEQRSRKSSSFLLDKGTGDEGLKEKQGCYNLRLGSDCFYMGELGPGLRQKKSLGGVLLGPCIHQGQQKAFTLEGKCGIPGLWSTV